MRSFKQFLCENNINCNNNEARLYTGDINVHFVHYVMIQCLNLAGSTLGLAQRVYTKLMDEIRSKNWSSIEFGKLKGLILHIELEESLGKGGTKPSQHDASTVRELPWR